MRFSSVFASCLLGALLGGCSGTPLVNGNDGGADHPAEAPPPADAAPDLPATEGGTPDAGTMSDADAGSTPEAGTVTDAGADGAPTDGAPTGAVSFAVTSKLNTDAGASATTHAFTLAVAADRTAAILGANGAGSRAPLEATAGGYRVPQATYFSVALGSCGGSVTYQEMTFTLAADGTLSGTGRGSLVTFSGDVGTSVAVTMTLSGVADRVAPTFNLKSAGTLGDPFSAVSLTASEPLPDTSQPRLVGAGGAEIPFVAAATNGFVATFNAPNKLLRFDETYRVVVDGIADFAGNAAAASSLQFTTKPAPPLIAEDGFESATGTTLGGAQVLAGSGAPTITGTHSLYIPPAGDGIAGRPRATQLALRLSVAPGDTVVRFAYRIVNKSPRGGAGLVAVASVGGTIGTTPIATQNDAPTSAMIGGQQVSLGPVVTGEIPLPADAAGEIVFAQIDSGAPSASCSLPPGTLSGLIIDDLRVE
jgi:hypothetical protein